MNLSNRILRKKTHMLGFKRLALAAILLTAAVNPIFAQSAAELQMNADTAYRKLLVITAHQRVEQMNCAGFISSTMQSLTEDVIEYSKTFDVLNQRLAIDIVLDAQGFRRHAVGRHCGDSRVDREETQKISDVFFNALKVRNEARR